MKKQDMNGVRVAQDLERKYKFQDIEKAAAQARAAVSGIQAKLDISEYEQDMQDLADALEELQDTLDQTVQDAIDTIEQATQDAIDNIQDELVNYVLISSTLTNTEIDNIVEGE